MMAPRMGVARGTLVFRLVPLQKDVAYCNDWVVSCSFKSNCILFYFKKISFKNMEDFMNLHVILA